MITAGFTPHYRVVALIGPWPKHLRYAQPSTHEGALVYKRTGACPRRHVQCVCLDVRRCGLHARAVTKFVTAIRGLQSFSSPPCLLRLLPAGAVAGWVLHPLEKAPPFTAHVVSGPSGLARCAKNPTFVRPDRPLCMRTTASTSTARTIARCYVLNTSFNARLGLGVAARSATPKRKMKVGSQPGASANLTIAAPKLSALPTIAFRSMHSTG
ncbi:hypothetical protein SAMN05519103_01825 [Rhizobiales bacterium GAS113]|nr:hypothetical protein SAMN05519103_01825 [Rhizobiales bacterium GAS113]